MKNILVVDDNEGIRDLFEQLFANTEYDLVICDNIKDAEKKLEAANLIITDLQIPNGLEGIELITIAREKRPDIPIILMTGQPDLVPENSRHNELIGKPFSLANLMKTVNRLTQD